MADRASLGQRLTTEDRSVDLRPWLEAGVGFLPFAAWLVAGISDTPRLAFAGYLAVAAMLVARPQLGYLALLPMLTFYHAQGFAPHGPMVVLSAVALASVLVRLAIGRVQVPPAIRPALLSSLGFLALTGFQLILGVHELGGTVPLSALSEFDQVFVILSVFAVGLVVLPGRVMAPYFLAFVVSFVIVAAVAILHFVRPHSLTVLGLSWLVSPGALENRASGVIANPNFLGLALACGLSWVIVSAVWQIAHGPIERGLWLVTVTPVAGLALILSFSRAAIVALGIGLVVALARRSLRTAGLLAATAVVAVVLIYPIFIQVRLGQTFGEASPAGQDALGESDRLRTLMAESAVKAFLDAPIAGHGFATFNAISPRYSHQSTLTSAHDLYLKVAAEQGLIGLAMLGALFISIAVPLWRAGLGPWIASLAVAGAFAAFSFTADSLGSAQTVSGAFFLLAAGLAQSSVPIRRAQTGERRSHDAGLDVGSEAEESAGGSRPGLMGSKPPEWFTTSPGPGER